MECACVAVAGGEGSTTTTTRQGAAAGSTLGTGGRGGRGTEREWIGDYHMEQEEEARRFTPYRPQTSLLLFSLTTICSPAPDDALVLPPSIPLTPACLLSMSSAPSPINVANVPTAPLVGDSRSAPGSSHPSTPRPGLQQNPSSSYPHAPSSADSIPLADILDTTRQRDQLKKELDFMRNRAETAERAFANLQRTISETGNSSGSPSITMSIISDYEDRIHHAERARDRAETRNRRLVEGWSELEGYIHAVEIRCAEARTSFSRTLHDGGSLALPTIPAPPASFTDPQSHLPRRVTGLPYADPTRIEASPSIGSKRSRSITIPPPTFPSASNLQPFMPITDRRVRPRDSYDYLIQPDQPPLKRLRNDHGNRSSRSVYPEPPSNSSNPYPSHLHPPPRGVEHPGRTPEDAASARPLPHASSSRTLAHPNASLRPHTGPRSRSSSSGSVSVDEMIIQATADVERRHPEEDHATSSRQGYAHAHLAAPMQSNHSGDRDHRLGNPPPAPPPSLRHPDRSNSALSNELPPLREHHPEQGSRLSNRSSINNSPRPAMDHTHSGLPEDPMRPQMLSYATIPTFAPIVTGPPSDRSKPRSRSHPDLISSGTHPAPNFPRTNAEGQRICRQCGVPGRYKDGKCVEKWGPGPHGPGTVCDRCRKKMKRIEKRETQESQIHHQFGSSLSQRSIGSMSSSSFLSPPRNSTSYQPSNSDRSIQRTDTLPIPFPHPSRRGPSGDVSSSTSLPPISRQHEGSAPSSYVSPDLNRHAGEPTHIESPPNHRRPSSRNPYPNNSPPPAIAVLNDESSSREGSGRIRSNTYPTSSRHSSRPGSAIGDPQSHIHDPGRILSMPRPRRRSRSPLSNSQREEDGDVDDVDADADADGDDLDADGEGERDIDDALLEAVEAAEAKITSGPPSGGSADESRDSPGS